MTTQGFPAGRKPDDIKRPASDKLPSPDAATTPPPVPPNLDPK